MWVLWCVYLMEATEVCCLLIGILLQPSRSFTGGLLEHKPTPSEDLSTENDVISLRREEVNQYYRKVQTFNAPISIPLTMHKRSLWW